MAEPEEDGPKTAPDWVVTFTDMISLLVTFFVLLMTYSSLDPRDFVKIGSLLDTHRGVLSQDQGDIAIDFSQTDVVANQDLLRGAPAPHSRPPQDLYENLEEMGQKESEDHVPVDLGKVRDGLRLVFDESCSFAPGSAEPPAELVRSLGEIARVLEHYSFTVVVEGFTDARFQSTARYPTAEVLSIHRARNAARVMLSESDLSPVLVQVAGIGAERPRASEESAEGRQLNRRVEVRVMALSSSRQAMLAAEREREERGER